MRLLICIDDTDNIDSKGTGAIADELRQIIVQECFGECGFITRHQLLLHSDVPYTSHNSSMCFDCEIKDARYEELLIRLFNHLQQESAPDSDPGLAVAKIDEADAKALLRFGMDAKRMLLSKEQAYKTAKELGVYLCEAGGTGQGVIGALAGVGLRLNGNDGEIRGGNKEFLRGETYTVEQLLQIKNLQAVCDEDQNDLPSSDRVYMDGKKAKPILDNGRVVLLVSPTDEPHLWKTLKKEELRRFGNERVYREGCERYLPDVEEEMVVADERSCLNCRYRRWEEQGFLCVIPGEKQEA